MEHPSSSSGASRSREAIALCVVFLGLTAVVTQLLALRAFLDLFGGCELTLGVILANWLLLTGIGCALGRRSSPREASSGQIVVAQLLVGVLPFASLAGITLSARLFPTGMMVGLGGVFWASLALLTPFCLLSGFLLTRFAGAVSLRRDAKPIGQVYALDSAGGILGGVLFSLVLVHFLEPLQIASGLLFANLLAALYLAHVAGRPRLRAGMVLSLVAAVVALAVTDLERSTVRARFAGLDVERRVATPYGDMVVTRSGGETTVFASGVPIGSTSDTIAAEESVHYALSQHPAPRDVLLLSGGLSGTLEETGRYPVEAIDYVELDPAILELVRELQPEVDTRVRWIAGDARRVVRRAHETYDAILMALPDPSTAQLSRFYTEEFFVEVRRALRPGGVFGIQLSGAENYAGPELRRLASSVVAALDTAFPHRLIVPGLRLGLVASDRPLSFEAFANLPERGIETLWVRPEFLTARLTEDRLADVKTLVSTTTAPNRDFRPGSYYAHLTWWLSRFGSSLLLPALLVLGVLIGSITMAARAPRRSVPAALFTSGFAGLGLEVVILIAFQVSFGSVYRELGWVITSFLCGAAVGAVVAGRSTRPKLLLRGLDVALSLVAFSIAGGIVALESGAVTLAGPTLFVVANGLVGLIVGAQLPPAAKLSFRDVERTAGEVFAFDLFGACLGALLVGALAIPLLGLVTTCLVLGGIKLVSSLGLLLEPLDVPVTTPERVERPVLAFGIMFLVLVGLGVAIVAEDTSTGVYDFSFAPAFNYAALGLLALGIALAIGLRLPMRGGGPLVSGWRRLSDTVYELTRLRLFHWASFLGLALVAFYPIFRCYFKVPWLFCHVCPRKCVFGYVRPYLIPAVLIMNLEKRFWCTRACPIGSLGTAQGRVCPGSRRPPRALRVISWLVLAFTVVSYFKIEADYEIGAGMFGDWYTYFYENLFVTSAIVVGVTAALVLATVWLRRPFCEVLCPVGRTSDLLRKVEQLLFHRSRPQRPTTRPEPEEVAKT